MLPAGALAYEEVDDPESIEPVAYEVVEEEVQQVARTRVMMRIVVAQGSDEAVGAAIAQALRDGLANHGEAIMAHVFAYYEGDDTDSFYTAGIGYAGEDGNGYAGDGELPGGMPDGDDDEGKIFVAVGSVLDDPDDVAELIFPLDA